MIFHNMLPSQQMKMRLAFLLVAGSFQIAFAPVAHAQTSVPTTALNIVLMSMLPIPTQSQQAVFTYLQEKSGHEVYAPDYPPNALLTWTRQNFEAAGSDPKKLYPAVYQQLLAAQPLLLHLNSQQRRRGLRVAHNANLKVATRLKDKRLTALIFDGFILPYLDVASIGVNDTLSRQRLLQDASSAYHLSGETEKRLAVLRLLLSVAEEEKNPNQADWARVKLAEGLAAQSQYQEAITHLQAVKASNLSGSKSWIPQLEKKLREQQTAAPLVTQIILIGPETAANHRLPHKIIGMPILTATPMYFCLILVGRKTRLGSLIFPTSRALKQRPAPTRLAISRKMSLLI
jgi:hypothetical protein